MFELPPVIAATIASPIKMMTNIIIKPTDHGGRIVKLVVKATVLSIPTLIRFNGNVKI